jgi:hypothetical protein
MKAGHAYPTSRKENMLASFFKKERQERVKIVRYCWRERRWFSSKNGLNMPLNTQRM